MDELRDIPGYEGLYAVTRDGRVWVHPRRWHTGKGWRSHDGFWRSVNGKRYLQVTLCRDGVSRNHHVHLLVAWAWVPRPEGTTQVNHKDGNKQNPHADNLEWSTGSANMKHAWRTGLQPFTPRMKAALLKAGERTRYTSEDNAWTRGDRL